VIADLFNYIFVTQHSPLHARPGTAQSSKRSRIPTGIRAPTPEIPPPRPTTTMKPFSFDQRNQQMLRRKEEKIKQVKMNEANNVIH
jgi:hypothetical protein